MNSPNCDNLWDWLEQLVASSAPPAFQFTLELRRHMEAIPDAAALITDKKVAASAAAWDLAAVLSRCSDITSVRRAGQKLAFRLADERIARAGEDLEGGRLAGAFLDGEKYLIDFCDPNANKSLHAGHLRNIALGSALVAAFQAAGARVCQQCIICDIGRNIAEAMAGYLQFGKSETPESAGIKADSLVGRCYSAYVRSLNPATDTGSAVDAPLSREIENRADLAQDLLARWSGGDAEVWALWAKLREWVLEGQARTLRRLGVSFDRSLYESEVFATVDHLIAAGLQRGIFTRTPEGVVVFETGKAEYQRVPLIRADGFPTEHMRAAAIWHRLQVEASDLSGVVHVMGDEWVAATRYWERILAHFSPCPLYSIYHHASYGIVYLGGSKMKSSQGDVILIDEILDRLAESTPVLNLAREMGGSDRETISRIVVFGYFLSRPATKSIEFSWDRIFDERQNPGWVIARAWYRASSAVNTSGPEGRGEPSDPVYRFAVIQANRFPRLLRIAISNLDVGVLMQHLAHLAQWYVDTATNRPTDRVVHTALRAGLSASGLVPRSAGSESEGALTAGQAVAPGQPVAIATQRAGGSRIGGGSSRRPIQVTGKGI